MKLTQDCFNAGNCISMTGIFVLLQTAGNKIDEIYKHFRNSKVNIFSLHKIKHCFKKYSLTVSLVPSGSTFYFHDTDVRCSVRNMTLLP